MGYIAKFDRWKPTGSRFRCQACAHLMRIFFRQLRQKEAYRRARTRNALDIRLTPIVSSVCLGSALIAELGDALIKLDIINEVVNKTGITKTKAEMAVETVFGKMKRALEQGDRIELRGFGVFTVKPRKTGIGRNPRTGAEVSIPPGKAVRFKPGKELQTLQ